MTDFRLLIVDLGLLIESYKCRSRDASPDAKRFVEPENRRS